MTWRLQVRILSPPNQITWDAFFGTVQALRNKIFINCKSQRMFQLEMLTFIGRKSCFFSFFRLFRRGTRRNKRKKEKKQDFLSFVSPGAPALEKKAWEAPHSNKGSFCRWRGKESPVSLGNSFASDVLPFCIFLLSSLKVIADEEVKLSSYLSICSFSQDKQGFYHDWQEALREEAWKRLGPSLLALIFLPHVVRKGIGS